MSTRAAQTKKKQPSSLLSKAELETLEKLLLTQTVHEIGAQGHSWGAVAKVLSRHPLLKAKGVIPSSTFTSNTCKEMYHTMIAENDLGGITEDNLKPQAPVNLRLAQIYYKRRMVEVADLIKEQEDKFKQIAQEIDDIRSGRWDGYIQEGSPPARRLEAIAIGASNISSPAPFLTATEQEPQTLNLVIQQGENSMTERSTLQTSDPNQDSKSTHSSPRTPINEEDDEDDYASVTEVIKPARDGKRKLRHSSPFEDSRERPSMMMDTESVEDRRTPTVQSSRASEEEVKRFKKQIEMIHQQISTHRNGYIFHMPIKKSEAPDYPKIVHRPMDLKTIRQKVKDGSITNADEYQRDIYLMFCNAMMFNKADSDVYTMAEDVRHYCLQNKPIDILPDDD